MHTLKQMESKQIGIRMPAYLVEGVDELIQDFNINRSTFIIEATKKMLKEQKQEKLYQRLETSVKEAKMMMDGKILKIRLEDTINELRNNSL